MIKFLREWWNAPSLISALIKHTLGEPKCRLDGQGTMTDIRLNGQVYTPPFPSEVLSKWNDGFHVHGKHTNEDGLITEWKGHQG